VLNMKKIMMAMVVMLMTISSVFAQAETQNIFQRNYVGVNSPLYNLDKGIERLRYRLAFRKQAKAQLKLNYAEERLQELEEVVNDEEISATAQEEISIKLEEEYEAEMDIAEEQVEDIEDTNTRNMMRNRVQERKQQNIQTLNRVRERIRNDDNQNNDNALHGLDNALEVAERQRKGQ